MVQAGFPYTDSISLKLRNIWSLFPPNPFAQALKVLSGAVSTPEDGGVSWSKRGECAVNDDDCVITIVCNGYVPWFYIPFIFRFPSLQP